MINSKITHVSDTSPTNATTQPRIGRTATLAATLALLVAVLCATFALPAAAATVIGNNGGSGVGTPQTQHQVASQPTGSSGALLFGAFCLAGILATAGGVLWYTVRTRRTLDTDPTRT